MCLNVLSVLVFLVALRSLTTQRWEFIWYYATHSTMFFLVIGRGQ